MDRGPGYLNGILSLPLQFVFGVIVANNLVVYFALVVSGYGMFLLAWSIGLAVLAFASWFVLGAGRRS